MQMMASTASSPSGALRPLILMLRIAVVKGCPISDTIKARMTYIKTLRKYTHKATAAASTPSLMR